MSLGSTAELTSTKSAESVTKSPARDAIKIAGMKPRISRRRSVRLAEDSHKTFFIKIFSDGANESVGTSEIKPINSTKHADPDFSGIRSQPSHSREFDQINTVEIQARINVSDPTDDFIAGIDEANKNGRMVPDYIFTYLNEMLENGHIYELRRMMKIFPVDKVEPKILVYILSVTKCASDLLNERKAFVARSEAMLKVRLNDLKEGKVVKKLLRGLV